MIIEIFFFLTSNQERQRCASNEKRWRRHRSRCLFSKGTILPLAGRGDISVRVYQPISLVTRIRRSSVYGLMDKRTTLFGPIISAVFEVENWAIFQCKKIWKMSYLDVYIQMLTENVLFAPASRWRRFDIYLEKG